MKSRKSSRGTLRSSKSRRRVRSLKKQRGGHGRGAVGGRCSVGPLGDDCRKYLSCSIADWKCHLQEGTSYQFFLFVNNKSGKPSEAEITALLKKHPDLLETPLDTDGRTALMIAVGGPSVDMVRYLLSQGASIRHMTAKEQSDFYEEEEYKAGLSVLMCAVLGTTTYKSGGDTIAIPDDLSAARVNYENIREILTRLVSMKVPPVYGGIDYQEPVKGKTALLFAVQRGDMEACRMLLDAGADVRLFTNSLQKYTPITMAIKKNNLAILELLLTATKDTKMLEEALSFNQITRKGDTALTLAVQEENLAILELLLSKLSARMDAITFEKFLNSIRGDKKNALLIAEEKNPAAVPLLLAKGAKMPPDDWKYYDLPRPWWPKSLLRNWERDLEDD